MLRPWQLLPVPSPLEFDPSIEDPLYFYRNFLLPLTKDFIRIMNNGLSMDPQKVENLKSVVANVLTQVEQTLADNAIIQRFNEHIYPQRFQLYKEEIEQSMRDINYYLKPYKESNVIHRTYLVNHYLTTLGKQSDTKDKWTVNDLKKYNQYLESSFLTRIISKNLTNEDQPLIDQAMLNLANDKLTIWNKPRLDKINAPPKEILLPPFNPASSKQKRELFDFLGIKPVKFSKKTGDASWGREQIEEQLTMTTNPELIELLQAFIDHSYGAIIQNNFLEAFDKYTINGKLHGLLRLYGAKSARPTSSNPNLLNMPSTGSIYAKPIKECFIAQPDFIVCQIDYSSLEDRIIANLSGDTNKLAVFTEGIDTHSLGCIFYFPSEAADILGHSITDRREAAKEFKQLVDSGNKQAKALRQKGKPITFGLNKRASFVVI